MDKMRELLKQLEATDGLSTEEENELIHYLEHSSAENIEAKIDHSRVKSLIQTKLDSFNDSNIQA